MFRCRIFARGKEPSLWSASLIKDGRMVIALHTLSTVGKSNELSNNRAWRQSQSGACFIKDRYAKPIAKTRAHTGWATGYVSRTPTPADSRYVAGCGHQFVKAPKQIQLNTVLSLWNDLNLKRDRDMQPSASYSRKDKGCTVLRTKGIVYQYRNQTKHALLSDPLTGLENKSSVLQGHFFFVVTAHKCWRRGDWTSSWVSTRILNL
jgi:hypothetical protein